MYEIRKSENTYKYFGYPDNYIRLEETDSNT